MVSWDIDDPWNDKLVDYNSNNFNNVLHTMVLIFETLTFQDWSIKIKQLVDSGHFVLSPLFFILIVGFGSYFMINLILAVILESFSKFELNENECLAENQEEEDD